MLSLNNLMLVNLQQTLMMSFYCYIDFYYYLSVAFIKLLKVDVKLNIKIAHIFMVF
jgi:hypothetical protein